MSTYPYVGPIQRPQHLHLASPPNAQMSTGPKSGGSLQLTSTNSNGDWEVFEWWLALAFSNVHVLRPGVLWRRLRLSSSGRYRVHGTEHDQQHVHAQGKQSVAPAHQNFLERSSGALALSPHARHARRPPISPLTFISILDLSNLTSLPPFSPPSLLLPQRRLLCAPSRASLSTICGRFLFYFFFSSPVL